MCLVSICQAHLSEHQDSQDPPPAVSTAPRTSSAAACSGCIPCPMPPFLPIGTSMDILAGGPRSDDERVNDGDSFCRNVETNQIAHDHMAPCLGVTPSFSWPRKPQQPLGPDRDGLLRYSCLSVFQSREAPVAPWLSTSLELGMSLPCARGRGENARLPVS